MTTYHVTAKRWAQGWELHIDGVGVTQVRSLARAEQQVRDYLETMRDGAQVFDREEIVIRPDIGELANQVDLARATTKAAAEGQTRAARLSREVTRELLDAGLSTTDVAALMGISKGRVSQLASKVEAVS